MKSMKSLLILGLVIVLLTPSLALAKNRRHRGGMSSTDWALALGSFAVANQLLLGDTVLHKFLGGLGQKSEPAQSQQSYPTSQPTYQGPQPYAAPQPYPVAVPQPYPVAVPQPYPVAIPQPYPVAQPAMQWHPDVRAQFAIPAQ